MAEGRKIAVILVGDVVGYSRLTGADEEGTVRRLRALRADLFNPTIDAHSGRIVKRTGDGVIVEFRSVVEAVRCALDVINGLAERNADLPADRCIEVRTGIHLGDVIEEPDGDLMGDGVNIAARLERVCAPGGICLSEDAWRLVRDKIPETFVDLGEHELKNIARPMRVFALGGADKKIPSVAALPARLVPPPPPVAVPDPPATPPARTLRAAAVGLLENVGRLVGAYADRARTRATVAVPQGGEAARADGADPAADRFARRARRPRDRTLRRMIIAAAILTVLAARACHGPQTSAPPPAAPPHARDISKSRTRAPRLSVQY